MQRAIVVKGRMVSPTTVELAEAVPDVTGEVEVVLRPLTTAPVEAEESVFAFLRRIPSGRRSKHEIDQQLWEERASWGEG